jgi:hypothetical protein
MRKQGVDVDGGYQTCGVSFDRIIKKPRVYFEKGLAEKGVWHW